MKKKRSKNANATTTERVRARRALRAIGISYAGGVDGGERRQGGGKTLCGALPRSLPPWVVSLPRVCVMMTVLLLLLLLLTNAGYDDA